jgi:hypothetical protein
MPPQQENLQSSELDTLLAEERKHKPFGNNFHFLVRGYAELIAENGGMDPEMEEKADLSEDEYKKQRVSWLIRFSSKKVDGQFHKVSQLMRLIRLLGRERFQAFSSGHRADLLRASELLKTQGHTPEEDSELNLILERLVGILYTEYGLSVEQIQSLFR